MKKEEKLNKVYNRRIEIINERLSNITKAYITYQILEDKSVIYKFFTVKRRFIDNTILPTYGIVRVQIYYDSMISGSIRNIIKYIINHYLDNIIEEG